ncbi:MAG: biotin/lipoyl-binding protein, partial [Gammaproteobacteria bacterium]
MRLKVFPQAFVLFLLLAITLALIWSRPEHQPELQDLAPTPVVVGSVQQTQLEPVEQVSGHLQPVRKVALQFQVAGRVAARHAEPGLRVATGQLLLELEAGDYQDAVIQARADWEQVQDNLKRDQRLLELAQKSRKLQEAEVARLNSLIERSLASKSRIGEAEAL